MELRRFGSRAVTCDIVVAPADRTPRGGGAPPQEASHDSAPPAGPVRSRDALALALLVAALGVPSCDSSTPTEPLSPNTATTAVSQVAEAKATVKVLATGLKFPRGFTFGANGAVYVAEAGLGGTHTTTTKQCDQVIPPVGPYTNGPTARISRIGRNGNRSTVASGFPSAINALGDVVGVADVAFVGDQFYALVAGGGCSHGIRDVPAGIAKVSSSGDWSIVADLSAYQATHHVAHPSPGISSPTGPGTRCFT